MKITEEQVIQWLHEKRKENSLKSLQLTVGESGVSDYHDFAAHTIYGCSIAKDIATSVVAVNKKTAARKALLLAQNS
jgi:hypothetical protein